MDLVIYYFIFLLKKELFNSVASRAALIFSSQARHLLIVFKILLYVIIHCLSAYGRTATSMHFLMSLSSLKICKFEIFIFSFFSSSSIR